MLMLSCEEVSGRRLLHNICINISLQLWVQLCEDLGKGGVNRRKNIIEGTTFTEK